MLHWYYTVGICVILLYPIVSLMLVCVAMSLGYIVVGVTAALPSSMWDSVNRIIGLVLRWVFSVPKKSDPYVRIYDRSLLIVFVRLVGSLVLFTSVLALAIQAHDSWLKPLVRNIAYVAEYYYLPDYPGIDRNLTAKIHENSVVSYARRDGNWNVEIIVDSLLLLTPSCVWLEVGVTVEEPPGR